MYITERKALQNEYILRQLIFPKNHVTSFTSILILCFRQLPLVEYHLMLRYNSAKMFQLNYNSMCLIPSLCIPKSVKSFTCISMLCF